MPPLAPHFVLSIAELSALQEQRIVLRVDDAIFRLEGSGAIACLQGLLTNDVAKAPDGTATWGAFLTPKGMIITDAWVIRDGPGAWVMVPGAAHESTQQLLTRTIPPRLASVVDHTGEMQVRWLLGKTTDIAGAQVVEPHGMAPFSAFVLTNQAEVIDPRLEEQGWIRSPATHADALKVLMGWPTLGREIDERTLPQEVRFDELGGVKYDKGCYTGQEIVARLHFRGHANRLLRGVSWAPGDGPTDTAVMDGDKNVGTLRTIAHLGDRMVALAIIRREIAAGDMIRTGESEGVVTQLPFEPGEITAP